MKNNIHFVKNGTILYSAFGERLAKLGSFEKVTVLSKIKDGLHVGIGWYKGDFLEKGFIRSVNLMEDQEAEDG